jgi:hypothetical protein
MPIRFVCLLFMACGIASAEDATIAIPTVTVPFAVEGQSVAVTTGGSITGVAGSQDRFRVNLQVDLSDFQRNLLAILRPQLDRKDTCGERIELQDATLVPSEPSGTMTVKLHYERWACVKALGKKIEKKLVGGNGVVQVKVTPILDTGHADAAPTTVHLSAEVGAIEADGSLGDLLRSGSLGQTLREKITKSMQSSIDKGTNWSATIPPALQSILTLRAVAFQGNGPDRLLLLVNGEVRIPAAQMEVLVQQLKQRPVAQPRPAQ